MDLYFSPLLGRMTVGLHLCVYYFLLSPYNLSNYLLFQLWYLLSKTLAEESAWKFAKEKGIDLITINPGMVIGPLLQPTINASAEEILVFLNGTFLSLTLPIL